MNRPQIVLTGTWLCVSDGDEQGERLGHAAEACETAGPIDDEPRDADPPASAVGSATTDVPVEALERM